MDEERERDRARAYYDAFAATYEGKRDGRGRYHDLLDALETELALPYTRGRDVLEVGCGTGLLLRRWREVARRATGVDLSPAMVARARERGLDAHVGDAMALPFDAASFDVVLSFKVLAHVPSLVRALREIARVLRPDGVAIVELYNPRSLRALLKRWAPAGRVGDGTERDVLVRFDDRASLARALPPVLRIERVRGIRTVIPAAFALDLPWLGARLAAWERANCDGALAARYGGFVSYVLRRSLPNDPRREIEGSVRDRALR